MLALPEPPIYTTIIKLELKKVSRFGVCLETRTEEKKNTI